MATTFTIKQHDRRPHLAVICTDGTGTAVDLTSASSIKFYMKASDGTLKVSASATPDPDQTNNTGKVTYSWVSADTDTVGRYKAEFEVTWIGGELQTFPTADYLTVVVKADLGP